jgi:hypothetical protein
VKLSQLWVACLAGALSCQGQATTEEPTPQQVLAKYLALPRETLLMRGVTMDTTMDGALPKMKKQGTMTLTRTLDAEGHVSYKMLGFEGDDQVKKDVIGRYLNLERETQGQTYDVGLNEKNYKINFKARLVLDGKAQYIYRLDPRRKAQGLMKGELWLDGETSLPLRETGRFIKNPSIFFKKTDVNQIYDVSTGRALLTSREWTIETRIVGKVEIRIKYSNHQPLAASTP